MNDEFAEAPEPLTFTEDEAIMVSPNSEDPTLPPPTDGSYTITNNTLIVAVRLSNASPTLQELQGLSFNFETMASVNTPEMASLFGVEIVPPVENELPVVPSFNETEQATEKDDEYYLPMVDFEFDDVQFLVPRRRFEETFPQSTLILPTGQDTGVVTQDGVSAEDFRALVEFMYPLDPLLDDPLQTLQSDRSWVSVLRLTSRWHMTAYRKQALTKLGSFHLPPEEKVFLGRLCGIPTWYREGCIALARGDSRLEIWHEATVGIDAMVKIARARDAAYRDDVVAFHNRIPTPVPYMHEIGDSLSAEDDTLYSSAGSTIVDDICTARANGLSRWLRSCYERLIDREESITLEEITSLGLDTTIGIWNARLQLFRDYQQFLRSTQGLSVPQLDFATHIEVEFANDIEEARLLQDIIDPPPSTPMAGPSRILTKKKKKRTTPWAVSP